MNLFKLAAEYRNAFDDLTAMDDLPKEVIKDTLDGIAGTFEDKAVAMAAHIENMKCRVVAIKSAIEGWKEKKENLEKQIDNCKNYILSSMMLANINKISSKDDPLFRLSIRKNQPKLDILDKKLIPQSYYKTEVKSIIDTDLVRSDLKEGVDVPGAQLTQGMSLSIK